MLSVSLHTSPRQRAGQYLLGPHTTIRQRRLLGSGQLDSGGGKTPGMVVPIAVLAATANPIGLIVMGTANMEGEITGRSKIEGAAKRTAEAIDENLKLKFQDQRWIEWGSVENKGCTLRDAFSDAFSPLCPAYLLLRTSALQTVRKYKQEKNLGSDLVGTVEHKDREHHMLSRL